MGAIVPKDRLARANGWIGLGRGFVQMVVPLTAGYLMASVGLDGVMVVEVCVVAAGALCVFAALSHATHAPRGRASVATEEGVLHGVSTSWCTAFSYLGRHRLLWVLLLYAALQESLMVLVCAMVTPLVLSTETSTVLGAVMTAGAAGGMVGSIVTMLLNVQHRLMVWVLATDALLSLSVAAAGMTTSPVLWGASAFVALCAGSMSGACIGALWMRKVSPDGLGSVIALLNAINLAALCGVVLVGGPVGERLLEPAMARGGAWAITVGPWLGTGPGRGYGLLFVAVGLICTTASAAALCSPRVRNLDGRLPDHDERQVFDDACEGQAVTFE